MDKDFVPYEQALELKELGFDEPCFGMYDRNEKLFIISPTNQISFKYLEYLCTPTFSQAFRWFREKYKIHSIINLTIIGTWYFELYDLNDKRNAEIKTNQNEFKTYEEAELACLLKLIEIVKNK
jgi:hypothetical protein